MGTIGNSGLFGNYKQADPIDDINEVGAAVDSIIETQADDTAGPQSVDAASVLILKEYVRRVRLLTWAVGIIALVLIIKEAE